MDKKILDVTCGGRMMWFDKENPDALFCDKRKESHLLCDGRTLNVNPDIKCDFTDLPFLDNSFYLVVFDPPHLQKLGAKSWLAKKYGQLFSNWRIEIKEGFSECMRVLKPNGTLIFKWNVKDIKLNEVLEVIGHQPLFGHTTSKNGFTIWMTFLKS